MDAPEKPESSISPGLEKILERALKQSESAKSDLDTLWTTQIIAVGASIALVVGLDDVASEAFLHRAVQR